MSNRIDFQDIDIISVLDELGISYNTEGKNISRNWIGVNCPFCDDPSNHLGINLDNKACSCFRCGKHKFLEYIKYASGLQWKEVYKLLSDCSSKPFFERKTPFLKQDAIHTKSNIDLPKELKELEIPHRRYLLNRGFNPTEIIDNFHVLGAPAFGYFAYRVVMPVYENKKLVNITGRDITEKADLRYLSLPNEEAVIPIKDCVYNIDAPGDKKIIVEGPTDTWRFGNYGLGMFSIVYTKEQIRKIQELNLKKAVVCFDQAADIQAEKLAWELDSFIPEVDIIYLNKEDPGSLTRKEAFDIVKTFLL